MTVNQEQLYLALFFCCLTFESGVSVHPVPNDGPQQQHGAGHHKPVYGREQQAVPVQLYQENSHGKVPHSVTLGIQILIIYSASLIQVSWLGLTGNVVEVLDK